MTERRSVPFVEDSIVIDASNAYSQPPTSLENEDGDVGDYDVDMDEVEQGFHGIDVGKLDAYIAQKDMDRELPFRRLYGYDSHDEGPQEELDEDGFTKEENQIHFQLTGLEKRTRLFQDHSLAHKAVVDGGIRNMVIEPTPCPDPGEPSDEDEDENAYLKKGVKFLTLDDMKVWLSDYAIRNHKPFYVEHSNINLWFTVKCEKGDEGCAWKVRGRKLGETRECVLRSCVPTHFCKPAKKRDRTTHRQLTFEYLGYKIMKYIAVDRIVKVRFLMRTAKKLYGYEVKYGKAWRAKENAIRMLYGGYEEAYNQLPRLLGAIAYRNPGMYHVVDDNLRVFHRVF
ncbi:hypothetical protein D1007_43646 [Hordeum vulgare]|nr:hypothetical protein D1007_43646 [Hordeum vulgare]